MYYRAAMNGKDPLTGKPGTPEDIEKWRGMGDAAWADYQKIAGKAKAAKPLIQQMGGLLKHVVGGGGGGQQQAQGGAAAQPPAAAAGGPQAAPPGTPGTPIAGATPDAPWTGPVPYPKGQWSNPPQPGDAGGAGAAPATQGSQTVPPPPQGQPQPKATVPPPPGMNPLQESTMLETSAAAQKEQDTLRLKDEEYRNKLAADSDPRYHVNEIKQFRSDIKDAFPQMSDEDVQKAVLTKVGVTPKATTGKEMQPDFKDGMLVGVKDPADNAYYTDPATMPPAALAIWKSGKHVEQEHESAQEAKENRQFLVQERLAGLREQIHDREQELAQSTKIPATEAGRASQAEIIKEQTADLREQLKDPELQTLMGPIAGRTTGFVSRLYNQKVQNFFAAQESLDALLPLLHGYRGGAQTHKTFKDAMGSLTIDPKAYAGTLDALDSMADNVTNEVQEEYPNAPMFKNKRDAGRPSSNARPRGGTVKPPPGSTVKMKAPNGMTKEVPADQVGHYKSLGATVVQ
jgi:hypothetical protein